MAAKNNEKFCQLWLNFEMREWLVALLRIGPWSRQIAELRSEGVMSIRERKKSPLLQNILLWIETQWVSN